MTKITRSLYADMFGPTTGDRLRLADTDIIIEVEKDYCRAAAPAPRTVPSPPPARRGLGTSDA